MSQGPFIPDIEPLPDTTWKSIERKLFAELDREDEDAYLVADDERDAAPISARAHLTRRVVFGVAACAAIAAAALVFAVQRDPAPERALDSKRVSGAVPAYVETSDSSTRLVVDGSSITVEPRSRLWYTEALSGVNILLEEGRVECAVRPQPAGSRFTVQAGEVLVQVVGTRFSVARHQDAIEVSVTEGEVEVILDGREITLRRGEHWSSQDPERTASHTRMRSTLPSASAPSSDGAKRSSYEVRKEAFFRALALEERDMDSAVARYVEMARGHDVWAANALYAHARLYATRGLRDDARRLVNEYLSRFPGGANRGDARRLLDELDRAETSAGAGD